MIRHDKLKHIGHQHDKLKHIGHQHDKLKHIGHQHDKLKRVGLCLIVSVVIGTFAFGQELPGTKKARTPSDYQSRTLKEIFALKPDDDDLRSKQGDIVTTRDILPSKVRVTFGGSMRLLPDAKKEVIRQWARLYAGSMEHYTEPYQTEILFVENGVKYWLAAPKGFAFFKNEPKKGTSWDLYLIRLGATVSNDKHDWTLLVENVR